MLILTKQKVPTVPIEVVKFGKCVLAQEKDKPHNKAVVWYSHGAENHREVTYFDGNKMTYSSRSYFEKAWGIIGPVMEMADAFNVTAKEF
jgi:hypothetical protein